MQVQFKVDENDQVVTIVEKFCYRVEVRPFGTNATESKQFRIAIYTKGKIQDILQYTNVIKGLTAKQLNKALECPGTFLKKQKKN